MTKIPGRDNYGEFLALFKDESDRAAVVLGGAYIDACLDDMLRTWLRKDVDEHFEAPQGFLSSYGAKYQLAHALGAIEDNIRALLKRIGAVRNHFAHHVLDARWDHPVVRKHMRALREWWTSVRNTGLADRDVYLASVAISPAF